jgi:predicted DNA-binding transcriptional regulator AlpA
MTSKTYTTAQVAKKLAISRQTLYTWMESGFVVAPEPITVGQRSFRLWTAADIERARKFKGTLKPGPQATTDRKTPGRKKAAK